MPRYYFHVCDGTQDIDEQGHELADDLAARREAVRYCCGLLGDDPDLLLADENLRVNVTAEDGHLRFAIVLNAISVDWQPGTGTETRRAETRSLVDTQR